MCDAPSRGRRVNTREHRVLTPAHPLPAVAAFSKQAGSHPRHLSCGPGHASCSDQGRRREGVVCPPRPTSSGSGGGAGVPACLLELPQRGERAPETGCSTRAVSLGEQHVSRMRGAQLERPRLPGRLTGRKKRVNLWSICHSRDWCSSITSKDALLSRDSRHLLS